MTRNSLRYVDFATPSHQWTTGTGALPFDDDVAPEIAYFQEPGTGASSGLSRIWWEQQVGRPLTENERVLVLRSRLNTRMPNRINTYVLPRKFEVVGAPVLSQFITPKKMMGVIREAWLPNVTQLSQILRVERPTIYLWNSLDDAARIRAHKMERLKEVYQLAEKWIALGNTSINILSIPIDTGETLLNVLSKENLNEQSALSFHALMNSFRDREKSIRTEKTRRIGEALGRALKKFPVASIKKSS